ncbi:MAG: DUF3828 domain-containing protein [Dysgonamonadaceae bacterium]
MTKKLLFIVLIGLSAYPVLSQGSEQTSTTTSQKNPQKAKREITQADALAVALKFINGYVAACNASTNETEWIKNNSACTPAFKHKLSELIDKAFEEDPEYGLGFDPILNAQDYPEEGFEVDRYDLQAGYAVVRGKAEWKAMRITVKLIRKDGKWYIDGCGIINIPKNRQS